MRRLLTSLLVGFAALLGALLPACKAEPARLRLATTTSTRDSGLLDALLPVFEAEARARIDVIAVGTGKALKLGEAGDVDVVMVHARAAEDAFLAAGHGVRREDLMWNTFELLGPPADPAQVKDLEIGPALRKIAEAKALFVSRGDDSGTHKKELALWKEAGGLAPWERYLETGQGMGRSLVVAGEKEAYVLSDRATFLAFRDKVELVPLVTGGASLRNPYGVMTVNPAKHPDIDAKLADAFVDFLIAERAQVIIRDFQREGERLFFPARLPAGD
ncbi:MAG: substrate-binding domain-containing protein [Deltaproteobacteria bacterium]|nr:substrate-binding domain-containing protein [Deltaproteobacteria bacterium]